ncbi:virB8 family protein [Paraburkholderia sp. GAS33]|uniref:virB8 family protein n=1 Tax=Paraburkholderia sp. GAS33 TaxID=3035130 RepID=UPI003D1F8FF8
MTAVSPAGTDPQDAGTAGNSALRDEAKWYLNQALEFEKSKQATNAKLTSVAWRVAIGAGVIAVVSIVCSAGLVQLKRPNPPAILRDDPVSGKVDVLDVIRDGRVPFGEVEDRADLRRYVTMRESYDWETIQNMFDAVKLMSADRERDQYVALYSLPNAPQKVLKDQFRVVANVGAITFVGSTAQVFFSKKLIPLGANMEPKTEYWVATIAYRHDNLPERKSELEIDPTGFRVTSYTVDRDWTRAPETAAALASPQVATAPSAAPQGANRGGQ